MNEILMADMQPVKIAEHDDALLLRQGAQFVIYDQWLSSLSVKDFFRNKCACFDVADGQEFAICTACTQPSAALQLASGATRTRRPFIRSSR